MNIIEILKVVLLGILEGITEWLPISSTGHLIILEAYLDVTSIFKGGKAFWDFFLVAIQLGAILAVIVCYFNKINPFVKDSKKRKSSWLLWAKVLLACLPAAFIGLILDDYLEEKFYNFITVSIMLIIYGIAFIIIEFFNKNRFFKINDVKDISFRLALYIGIIQLLALIPGTSRSGVTILGAMILLCNREVACEFSFLLSIPVMLGASLLKIFKYLLGGNNFYIGDLYLLFIGVIVSFLVSILVIKLLLKYIKKNDFTFFGIYRIILGVALILIFILS